MRSINLLSLFHNMSHFKHLYIIHSLFHTMALYIIHSQTVQYYESFYISSIHRLFHTMTFIHSSSICTVSKYDSHFKHYTSSIHRLFQSMTVISSIIHHPFTVLNWVISSIIHHPFTDCFKLGHFKHYTSSIHTVLNYESFQALYIIHSQTVLNYESFQALYIIHSQFETISHFKHTSSIYRLF